MSADVRLGIVGTGRIGRVHADAYARVTNGRLIACTDAVSERAEAFARDYELDLSADFESLLKRDDIDGVLIATPNWLHAEMTIAALAAGKHVFCQKPMALTLQDADAVEQAASKTDRILQFGFMLRFTPPLPAAQSLIASGALGDVIATNAVVFGWEPNAEWFYDKAAGGGVVLDTMIHIADLVCWLAGDVDRVHAEGGAFVLDGSKRHASPDNASVLMRHVGGAASTIYVTWTAGHGNLTYEVYGTEGSLNIDLVEKQASRLFLRRPHAAFPAGHSFPEMVWAYSYVDEQQYFVDQIRGVAVPGKAASSKDARRALAVALAAQKALDEGKSVSI